MPSKRPRQRLTEIVITCEDIESLVKGVTFERVVTHKPTFAAACYFLLIISEAASKLEAEAEQFMPSQNWIAVRRLGNILRHEYDRLNADRIWKIITEDLPGLRADCEAALAGMPDTDP